jgi:phospholipid/cholesterol/gamma-HCH transport system substrate-binding protein
MRGVKVGAITSFGFSQQRPRAVEVFIAVDPQTPVRETTGAVVERNILTGLATLQLVNAGEDSPLLTQAPPSERYPVIGEGKSNMEHVSQSLDQLVQHADETMRSLNAILSPDNRAALTDVLRNVRRATQHADATLAKADAALVSFGRTSDEVRNLAHSVADDAQNLTARYDSVGAEATAALGDARDMLRRIGNDADHVAQRADEALDGSGEEVRETARSLRAAADSIAIAAGRLRNPQQAIFGPAAEALGPGERER